MIALCLNFVGFFILSQSYAEQPSVLLGEPAKFLYEFAESMRFADDPAPHANTVEFFGGCYFTLQGERLERQFCECHVGRIHDPAPLLRIVQPYLGFAPFPDFDDEKAGIEGRSLGIDYKCERSVELPRKFRCELKDYNYIRR